MNRNIVISALAVAAVLGAGLFAATPSIAHGPGWGGGPGGMAGPGGGPGGMMGRGGRPCLQGAALDGNVSVDEVKAFFEKRLAWRNNPNVKLGAVTEVDANTITAEIVTKDGSLVQKFQIDRKSGVRTPAQ